MIDYTLQQIAALTGGVFMRGAEGSTVISSVSIDTRTLKEGALYVPVRGDVFDGHRFIGKAFEAGAAATFAEYDVPYPHILVKDAVKAFQLLAKDYRERFHIPFVGITGSAGKTTTKEMTACVLSSHFNTLYTKGNLNNQTGVPQVLFQLNEEHECAVIEMGTNHFGEIDSLAAMAEPDVCLFTNIGEAHIEFFGSRAGIFKGKTEMLAHMREGGAVIANGDDDYLSTIPGAFTYGLGETCRLRAVNIREKGLEGVTFTACHDGKETELFVPAPGRHNVYNALAAMAAGIVLGVPEEKIGSALASFVPPEGRQKIETIGGVTVINDAYNANPASMLSSLGVLAATDGKKACVLGDMLELGPAEEEAHLRVLKAASALPGATVIPVGPRMRAAAEELGLSSFETREDALPALLSAAAPGSTVLIKGSRGMALEHLVEALKTHLS